MRTAVAAVALCHMRTAVAAVALCHMRTAVAVVALVCHMRTTVALGCHMRMAVADTTSANEDEVKHSVCFRSRSHVQ